MGNRLAPGMRRSGLGFGYDITGGLVDQYCYRAVTGDVAGGAEAVLGHVQRDHQRHGH